MKDPRDRYLIRLYDQHTKGWQLRVPARVPPGPMTHFFADSNYGGADSAKEAARAMRDRMFERVGQQLQPRGHFVANKDRPAQGLPVGITLGYKAGAGRRPSWYWIAYWSEDGRQRKKGFSVNKLGFGQALALALELRLSHTGIAATPEQVKAAWAQEPLTR